MLAPLARLVPVSGICPLSSRDWLPFQVMPVTLFLMFKNSKKTSALNFAFRNKEKTFIISLEETIRHSPLIRTLSLPIKVRIFPRRTNQRGVSSTTDQSEGR
eukprot:3485032-Pyramimonas_sp.AAC.1